MQDFLRDCRPEKKFLLCVDSDGCAMDTMDVKHIKCFGPQWVEVFGLTDCSQEAMKLWLDLNLYTRTRGINRFAGLAKASREMARRGAKLVDLEPLEEWVGHAKKLSNPALEEYLRLHPAPVLTMALDWSRRVNDAIAALPADDKPYPMVKEGLAAICKICDIVGVSSANSAAVEAEWQRHGLKQYTRALCCQECGSKAEIIRKLLERGYLPENTVMVGDAFGDRNAAEANGVHFYPILVGKEADSWTRLTREVLPALAKGAFDDPLQRKLNREMEEILK